MKKGSFSPLGGSVLVVLLTTFFAACGGGYGGNGGGGGGGGSAPAAPTGVTATAGTSQVALSWTASSGATSYHVKRSAVTGGPYTQVGVPSTNSYTDTGLTGGTAYYYVVSALNSYGESANSTQASATPTVTSTAVNVTVDVMSNRHYISPYVYGGNGSKDAASITDSGIPLVRWGGNASSTYNWQLHTYNADNDYFFEDFGFGMLNNPADSDSAQFIQDVKTAGSHPLMTMAMLPWVAQSAESAGASGNLHWTFSVSHDSACASKVDQFNTDAGVNLKSDCTTPMVASPTQLDRAYFPLLDNHTKSCPPAGSTASTCVYRDAWAAAMAAAFGSTSSCPIPYSSLTSCHFYDMDNETDIWGGTHVDVHPNPAGYDELRDTYLLQARNLKGWDPAAVTLGPVSCCWWFYWNGANSNDKGAHAGVDFLPWWLNEVYWRDQIAGSRSLDLFDIHAYPDGPDLTGMTTAQKRAFAVSIYRDYWDPTLVSPSGTVNQTFTTSIQPDKTIAFRIPRMRAIVNSIYPGTPLATTEWSAGFVSEADFSTALGDADAYGILGRERVSLSTRWGAPDPANPNYQALKLYTNYDGSHHGFNPISVSATHNAAPDLFSVYAATNGSGNSMTLMVLNKDPSNAAQVSFSLNGFTPSQVTTYTLSQSSQTSIVAGTAQAWPSSMTFQPYTATVLVISGSSTPPASEWELNPDATMLPANGSVTLAPRLASGTASVTLNMAVFDSYEGAPACNSGSISLTNPTVASGTPGTITLNAAAAAGFCHFSVTASDGTTQGGWLVVGNPAATLAKTAGDAQSGTAGTVLPTNLTVTLSPGSSGGTAAGASLLVTTSAGSLSNVQVGSEQIFTGPKVIAVTNGSGVAKVTLTLPATAGAITITAEGPYGLGHPVVTFNETAN
jgi:glycosyl hydrolase family 44/fibronectin type III domain protein